MSMTDPVADLLTRIRNATATGKKRVDIPHSRLKEGVVDVLLREGYVLEKQVLEVDAVRKVLRVVLKYGPDGEKVIGSIQKVSKPGKRVYSGSDALPRIQGGLGITVVSTSQGVLSDREARAKRVGGEVLAAIW